MGRVFGHVLAANAAPLISTAGVYTCLQLLQTLLNLATALGVTLTGTEKQRLPRPPIVERLLREAAKIEA